MAIDPGVGLKQGRVLQSRLNSGIGHGSAR